MNYSSNNSVNSTILKSKIEKRTLRSRVCGGEGLHNRTGYLVCSAGLLMTDADDINQSFLLTAGHCSEGETPNNDGFIDLYHLSWNSPPSFKYIGPLVNYSIAPYNFGLIRLIGERVAVLDIIRDNDGAPYEELFVKGSKRPLSVGAHVCKSGHATFVSCGQITELNAELTYRDSNNNTITKKEMIVTSVRSVKGDSGGPVFSYSSKNTSPDVYVVGILIGGMENHGISDVLPLEVVLRNTNLVLDVVGGLFG
ncbi:4014_t:CDS:1 [Gigaspora margarita]|uniref:4014_t:CDS:1 n=1 Tax=Gigaspora margarita TaxID=4874 RepID=A0ABN7VHT2_GIGMA|nr:4014_t:CDS:1 [Gigaspora margarita]